jgi:hypothetical protein
MELSVFVYFEIALLYSQILAFELGAEGSWIGAVQKIGAFFVANMIDTHDRWSQLAKS